MGFPRKHRDPVRCENGSSSGILRALLFPQIPALVALATSLVLAWEGFRLPIDGDGDGASRTVLDASNATHHAWRRSSVGVGTTRDRTRLETPWRSNRSKGRTRGVGCYNMRRPTTVAHSNRTREPGRTAGLGARGTRPQLGGKSRPLTDLAVLEGLTGGSILVVGNTSLPACEVDWLLAHSSWSTTYARNTNDDGECYRGSFSSAIPRQRGTQLVLGPADPVFAVTALLRVRVALLLSLAASACAANKSVLPSRVGGGGPPAGFWPSPGTSTLWRSQGGYSEGDDDLRSAAIRLADELRDAGYDEPTRHREPPTLMEGLGIPTDLTEWHIPPDVERSARERLGVYVYVYLRQDPESDIGSAVSLNPSTALGQQMLEPLRTLAPDLSLPTLPE